MHFRPRLESLFYFNHMLICPALLTLRVEMVADVGNRRRQWQWPIWNSLTETGLTMKETRYNEIFMGSMVFKPRRFRNN